jgi:hypothetical protein
MSENIDDSDTSATYVFNSDLNLTEEEKTRLIFHSFTNMLNVLLGIKIFNFTIFIFRYDRKM